MVFEDCPQPLGCTVLLYGAPLDVLVRVKRVMKFAVLAAYHGGLEVSFLAEELALATAALATEGEEMSSLVCF
jgi:1-phosphatidylinositol-3-phosphate 5-kinase